ncbi:MAG: alpha-L-fucosidase [Bacteroidia bacterium]|nr:alpha-L-fucosidase [Bacteroidia bacterium]
MDEPIANKFGYIEGLQLQNSASVIKKLVADISRNGNLMLNISPKGDGTIPDDQRKVLLEVGAWLKVNGDGVYGTHAWIKDAESVTNADGKSVQAYRFTKKGDNLYAFLMVAPSKSATIQSLSTESIGKVNEVRLLGYDKKLTFEQSAKELTVQFPDELKIEALSTLKVVLK